MRNKIQAPGKQVLHKQVPKAQALQKEKDPRLVAVGGFGQVVIHTPIILRFPYIVKYLACVNRGKNYTKKNVWHENNQETWTQRLFCCYTNYQHERTPHPWEKRSNLVRNYLQGRQAFLSEIKELAYPA